MWKGWSLIVLCILLLDATPNTFHPQNTGTFAFPLRMAISKHRCSVFPPTPALKIPLCFSWAQTVITCSTLSSATMALIILPLAPPIFTWSLCQSFHARVGKVTNCLLTTTYSSTGLCSSSALAADLPRLLLGSSSRFWTLACASHLTKSFSNQFLQSPAFTYFTVEAEIKC